MTKRKDDKAAKATKDKRNSQNNKAEETAVEAVDGETAPAGNEEFPEEVIITREQFIELKKNMGMLQKERDEYLDDMKRMKAEFENYRKRNQSLRVDSLQEGICDAVEAFLPVLDNLERAVAAAEKKSDTEALSEGMNLVCKQFEDVLAKFDIETIPTEEGFDPNIHNAIAQGEAEEGQQPGDIQEVFQKGYRQGEKVIRYSMVKVVQE